MIVTYVKTLFGKKSDIHKALSDLDKMTAQEGQIVVAASFKVTNEILEVVQSQLSGKGLVLKSHRPPLIIMIPS